MENSSIEPYVPEKDQAVIRAMLRGQEPFEGMFQKNEAVFPEGIFVVRVGGVTAAFLSIDGIKRKADTTIFVSPDYRRMGIGGALMAKADSLLSGKAVVERAMGACVEGDRSTLQFLYKNGYYISYSSYVMKREGEPLPESPISVRPYEDEDYTVCHQICEIAFFHMHERIGLLPSYYFPPNERERRRFAEDKHNRFVMLVKGEIAAVGIIGGNELSHVSVRPELQSRGYGGAFVSFLVNEIMRRGETVVKLGVVKGNPAKHLYERLGFRETSLNHWLTKYYRPDTRLSRPPSEL
ncbi:MAG: hypothetical protein K0Q59_5862 [Paenibacillus sp.]|nr:hypothetical protein [Paenibacillus sp.]